MAKVTTGTLLVPAFSFLAACSGEHGDGHEPETGAEPGGGTFSTLPSPAILVANGGDGTVSAIDPTSMAVVSTVPVRSGLHPHHMSVSSDGSRVLVTATSADLSVGHGGEHASHGASATTEVYQIDIANGEMRRVLDVGATAHNAAFTRDDSTIVLAMLEHGMLTGYDPTTFAETIVAAGFNLPLEVTPTNVGALLVAESGAGRVSVFDLATQAVTSQFDVGPVPVAAWASGGSNYFVSVEEGRQVRHVVEADSMLSLDSHAIEAAGMPGQAVVTPDGVELWVAIEDRSVVAVFDAVTHDPIIEFAAGTKPHGIVFEPSGSRAFITDEGGSRVLVADVAGHSVLSEITVGSKPNGIVWLQ